jgi:hypothetical protein
VNAPLGIQPDAAGIPLRESLKRGQHIHVI